jgi:hypothetical protein
MNAPPPALLLSASLLDPDWIGAQRLAELAASPFWRAIARRAATLREAGPDGPPPHDPGHERWLRVALWLPADAARAAAAAFADGAGGAAWRIDPVHLHVGRDHLVLTDPRALPLAIEEARALAGAIAPLLADEGLTLDVPGPRRWYLREADPARPLHLLTRPLAGAIGRNIDAWQPRGDDARRWRRIVNEIQMTWHAHPVNARRESEGLAAVNSVWLEGRCPAPSSGVECDAAARLAVHESANGPAEVELSRGGRLHVDDRLLDAQLAGDPSAWLDAWRRIETDTLGPIARAEDAWRVGARLVLAGDAGWREIAVAPRATWRLWRRADPAALLAEPAAAQR